jgi:ornithine cyclodeaminase/alanine dehydrogenase-like protein (mu-crystallin family)
MQKNQLLYLSQAEVASVGLSIADIIAAVETAFEEKGNGRVEMPPKPGVHPGGDNFIHAMPAYIPGLQSAGVKWVSGFPENPKQGLPYISGLLIYNDVATGLPLAVMDCVWITAMRTAAASAIGAKYLARPDSSTLGVLGCGVQGRSHVEALNEMFPLQKVMAYDVDSAGAQRFATEMNDRFGLEVIVVSSPREAVSGCDLVVTAGPILKQPHQTIKAGWLDEGAFASLVDFDSYWHPDAMMETAKFCTDDVPQLRHYQSVGYFQQIPAIHGDLGELVTGQKPGRETETERTMTANLGLAMDDMAVAPLIYKKALAEGIGTWLPL